MEQEKSAITTTSQKIQDQLRAAYYTGFQTGYQAGASSAETAANTLNQFLPGALAALEKITEK